MSIMIPSYEPAIGPRETDRHRREVRARMGTLSKLKAALTRAGVEEMTLSRGVARVIAAGHMPEEMLAATHLAEGVFDHRYYRVVQRSMAEQFELKYLVLHDDTGRFRGAQPFFLVNQNILAGVKGKVADLADRVRRRHPRFMTLKTLMVGNPAGPGSLGVCATSAKEGGATWFTQALSEALSAYARRHRVRIVVFKDFPEESRAVMAALTDGPGGGGGGADYARLPSMPMTRLSLTPYKSFEDYMQRGLSKITRKGLRRKFRDAADAQIEMSVTNDVSDCIDDVYRLYLQVYERAGMKFEKLTPEYFLELGRRMPDRARFFLWRQCASTGVGSRGRLVAVSTTLVRSGEGAAESALYDLYLGMEYPLALDLHLYFLTMRDVIEWSLANGVEAYYSTPLNYEAKLHFRHRLVPQDLYVRHTSPVLNPAFKVAMRFAEPTRHDKILPRFPNAQAIKGSP